MSMIDCIPTNMLENYLDMLVNAFYKILPLSEENEPSRKTYMVSLQAELIGCKQVINSLSNDGKYLSLIAILQYLINTECSHDDLKREVFKAISICKKLKVKYCSPEVQHGNVGDL